MARDHRNRPVPAGTRDRQYYEEQSRMGMVPVNPEVPSAPPKGFDSSYAGETWDDGANDYEVF